MSVIQAPRSNAAERTCAKLVKSNWPHTSCCNVTVGLQKVFHLVSGHCSHTSVLEEVLSAGDLGKSSGAPIKLAGPM